MTFIIRNGLALVFSPKDDNQWYWQSEEGWGDAVSQLFPSQVDAENAEKNNKLIWE